LLTMICAAAATEKWLLVGDGWVALAGGLGLILGFVAVSMYSRLHSDDQRFCPKMIRSIGYSKIQV